MASVVTLGRYRNRETRELLDSLSILADSGDVLEVLVATRGPDGSIRVMATGSFSGNAEQALTLALEITAEHLDDKTRLRTIP